MKPKSSVQLKDFAVPGILAFLWVLFLLWYGATF